jgi:hypothetical protein
MSRWRILMILLIIIGVAFIALAIYYWVTPAGSLPSYVPGYLAGSAHKHVKHGVAAWSLESCVSWGPGCCPPESRSHSGTCRAVRAGRARDGSRTRRT